MTNAMQIDQVARFPLGRVVATPGALNALEQAGMSVLPLLVRHQSGDWGQADAEDWQANEDALQYGWWLLSSYEVGSSVVWIITDAVSGIQPPAVLPHPCGASDRTTTTLLLPEEY